MALIKCSECNNDISSNADSCPHCGNPILKKNQTTKIDQAAPIFLGLSIVGLFILFSTPVFLVFIPLIFTLGCAVTSLIRKEKAKLLAICVLILTVLIWVGTQKSSGLSSNSVSQVESSTKIINSTWSADPEFGTKGTIKWAVEVKNISDKHIQNAKVEFTTYDKSGKLVSSDFSYVSAIPAGESRSKESYADLYGIEETAAFKISEVHFAK